MQALIRFHYMSKKPFYFPQRKPLKKFLFFLFKNEKCSLGAINYIFCSDSYLLKLNQEYLSHNSLTDIITFPFFDIGLPIISDIYISIDRIIDNSKSLGIAFKMELHRVIFHGALHLCGYDDKSESDKIRIQKKEDFYLRKYFVPRET